MRAQVGVGCSSAKEVATAIQKAVRDAKKNLVKINITKDASFPHFYEHYEHSAKIMLRPAAEGTGDPPGQASLPPQAFRDACRFRWAAPQLSRGCPCGVQPAAAQAWRVSHARMQFCRCHRWRRCARGAPGAAGIKNGYGKQLGTGNRLNNARACVNCLRAMRTPRQVRTPGGLWHLQLAQAALSQR